MMYTYTCFWCKKEYKTDNMWDEVCSMECGDARRSLYGRLCNQLHKYIGTRIWRTYYFFVELRVRKKCPKCGVPMMCSLPDMQYCDNDDCTDFGNMWFINPSGVMVYEDR